MNKYNEIKDGEKHLLFYNKKIYNQIISYISSFQIQEDELISIKLDILYMALNAQQRGESLTEVVGGDYKQFCDSIVNESSKKTIVTKIRDIFLSFSFTLNISIVIILIINAFIDIDNIFTISLGNVVLMVINVAAIKLLLYHAKRKDLYNKKFNVIGLFYLVVLILSTVLLVKLHYVKLYKFTVIQLIIIAIVSLLPALIIKTLINKNKIYNK